MPIKFRTTVQLLPKEIDGNFDATILNKLKQNLENICSKHGYIKKDTLKIIKRSLGYFKEHHFNGNMAFDIQCIAEICNPAQNSIITCKVKAKNELGLLAEGSLDGIAIMEVIVPKKSYGMQSEVNIDTISIGDEIKVEVLGKEFTLYDKKIFIIGKVIKDKDNNIVVHAENTDDEDNYVLEALDIPDNADEIEADDIGLDENSDDDVDSTDIKKLHIIDTDDGDVRDAQDDDEEEDEEEEDDEEEEEDEFEDDFVEDEVEEMFQLDDDE